MADERGDLAVTLILETPKSDIHQCPACGAQCAVERDLVMLARDSGQRIRVACHKCDEIFQPLNDNMATDILPGAAQPSRPNPNPRVGVCRSCGDSFSVPPLAAEEAVMVECPHCRHLMQPDDVGHASAMDELGDAILPPSARQKRIGTILSLFLAGALLAGFAAIAVFKTTPMPAPFGLDAIAIPHFAVTEARFDAALDGAEGAVLVTVGFANLGTAPGAPERVVVSLLDDTGTPVITRPIAVREAPLAPGGRRTLTARMSVRPDRVQDMTVSLVVAEAAD